MYGGLRHNTSLSGEAQAEEMGCGAAGSWRTRGLSSHSWSCACFLWKISGGSKVEGKEGVIQAEGAILAPGEGVGRGKENGGEGGGWASVVWHGGSWGPCKKEQSQV